jgi:hypothetical protein
LRPLSVVLIVACLLLAACGTSSSGTSSSKSSGSSGGTTAAVPAPSGAGNGPASAEFVLHTGLAFEAFHQSVNKPLRAADLTNPHARKLTMLKVAAAATFARREIKLASQDAMGDPTLAKLIAPLGALGAGIEAAVTSANSGKLSTRTLDQANATIDFIESAVCHCRVRSPRGRDLPLPIG